MKQPNLNPWYAVLWRTLVRRVRRLFYDTFDTPMRRRLYEQKRHIAHKRELTDDELTELARINWKLGTGSVYHLTPIEREERRRLADKILADIRQKKGNADA